MITVGVIGPGVPELVSLQGLERGAHLPALLQSQTRLGKPLNPACSLAGLGWAVSALGLWMVEKAVVKKNNK